MLKKVVINRCSMPGAWYSNMIGRELVVRESEEYYWAKEEIETKGMGPWNIIKKEDCTWLV